MDETKKTTQDISPDKETSSGGKTGTTSKEEPQTYTQEQAQKMVNDALSQAGRDAKTLEQKANDIKTREEAIRAKEEAEEAAKIEALKNDPDKLAEYQERQSVKKEREQLERDKAEHAAEIQAARETQKEVTIWQVASAKSIDPVRLKKLSEKFGIEGKEKLEELADEIGSGKTNQQIEVDSGVTTGGGKDLSGKSPIELAREAYEK
jgi:hypothetical protein